jgi:ABC-2 type transport system ATP-binding protein
VLALRGVSRSYGARRAVDDVTLEVGRGERVLLVGPNGAGKTTLLRVATGYLDPDAGTVVVDGRPMATARTAAQRRLGYLPEHAPAPAELTVHDHLRLRAGLKGLGRAVAEVARVIAAAELGAVATRRIATLSKGFRQRVGLADALLGAPPVLILDEPTSGMDPVQVRQLVAHLIEASGDGALLVSTHAVGELGALATRVVVVVGGRVVADGPPAALVARLAVARLEDAVLALLAAAPEAS